MKVEKGKKIFVNRLEGEKGASVDFTKVLLTDDNGSVKVGTPYVEGVNVKATIVDHVKPRFSSKRSLNEIGGNTYGSQKRCR